MNSPLVTIAIPLYRSARFLKTIQANIADLDYPNLEILISDRHCLDDSLDQLAVIYQADPRVKIMRASDQISWIEHYNLLLKVASGKYLRWVPHDDLYPKCALQEMVASLEGNPDAILAYGPITRVDENDQRIDAHEPDFPPDITDWGVRAATRFFRNNCFFGTFKGLYNRDMLLEHDHFIEPTRGNVMADRCWTFGAAMIGRFIFLPETVYIKRFYSTSTHGLWKHNLATYLGMSKVYYFYLKKFARNKRDLRYGQRRLILETIHELVSLYTRKSKTQLRKWLKF